MNFAGIFRVVYDEQTGQPTRVPSNNPGLAIRVDELWRLYDVASGASRIANGLSRAGAAGGSTDVPLVLEPEQDYPHASYRPFPDGWNGGTLLP